MDEIKKIMADCKRHKIRVLNPDVNESDANFTVNKKGDIHFGMGGMKGFGANIVDAIIKEREANGLFKDIYDFCERMSGTVNRKAMESLVYAGAFDSFGIARSSYFQPGKSGAQFIDELMDYAAITKKNAEDDAASLFGEVEELKAEKPEPPVVTGEIDNLELLKKEKDIVGMYLSEHPLKKYEFEIENFTTCPLTELDALIAKCDEERKPQKANVAGLITSYETKTSRSGKPYARVNVEDFSGTYELSLYGKDYETYMSYLNDHTAIYIEGEIKESYYVKPEEKEKAATVPYKFRLKNISLLGNIAERMVAGFVIEISTTMLNPDFRESLKNAIKGSKGNIPLSIFLVDPKTKYQIEFLSKKFQVAVTSDFLADVKNLGVRYKILPKR